MRLKMSRRLEKSFLQKEYTNIYGKISNNNNHQINADPNHRDVTSHVRGLSLS
jgi:hypothetical protein